jgi:hypothetical protein
VEGDRKVLPGMTHLHPLPTASASSSSIAADRVKFGPTQSNY